MPISRSVAGSYCNVSTSFLPPKPESHTHPYEWVGLLEQGRELRTVSMRVKDEKGHREEHAYPLSSVPAAKMRIAQSC